MKNSNSNGLWTALAIVLLVLLLRFSCTGRLCSEPLQEADEPMIGLSSCLGSEPSGFGGGSTRGAGAGGRG